MPKRTQVILISGSKGTKFVMVKGKKGNILFELFAPYNEEVAVVGSWNDWKPTPMTRNDQGCWQVEVPLEDGSYEYQFELISKSYWQIGKKIRVADPTAICLTRGPNEKACLKVENGQKVLTSYQWKHDDHWLPSNEQMIIYELHVGDFYTGSQNSFGDKKGCFVDVTEKLDYLVDLGINTIELMPANEFLDQDHWGYSQRSLYAVENSYGSPDDLCQLIDECHARGIRVIYDAVYNHMQPEAPLTQIDYTYWFYKDNPDDKDLQFGPKFNFEFYDESLKTFPARDHVIGAMKFWIDTFHLDGLRYDAARALNNFDLMSWFTSEAHNEVHVKPFYTVAEYIPENPAVAGPGRPMDAAWHENLSKQLMCTMIGKPVDGHEPYNTGEILHILDARNEGYGAAHAAINYIDNHDQDHIMYRIGKEGGLFDEPAFRRVKMGAALLLTAPGIPLLWMGQEFGASTPRRLDPQPLDWSYLDHPLNADLHCYYQKLINLRKNTPALSGTSYEPVADFGDRGVIAYKRWNDEGNVVLVVANLKPEYAGEVVIGGPNVPDGNWHEAVFDYDVHIEGNTLKDTFAESEVKIYVKQS